MSFIITASAIKFYPLSPTVEMVCLYDIAHALSKVARWTGHTKFDEAYSVAQHAYAASYLVPAEFALEALHHDSSEAYMSDVSRPLKQMPEFRMYREVEAELTQVIYQAFDIPYTGLMSPEVREVDERMLYTEARDLMPQLPANDPDAGWYDPKDAYAFHIDSIWSPRLAKERFIERHTELMEKRNK